MQNAGKKLRHIIDLTPEETSGAALLKLMSRSMEPLLLLAPRKCVPKPKVEKENQSWMASLLNPPLTLPQNKLNPGGVLVVSTSGIPNKYFQPSSTRWSHRRCLLMRAKPSVKTDMLAKDSVGTDAVDDKDFGVVCMHHVGILCENLERSLDFYQNILGLEINEARPHDKLPYRGAWLWVGSEMIHLMELPNPDPLTGRPEHGGRDRHTCIAIRDVSKLKAILDKAGIPYTLSRSGRPAIFTRDPDTNALEFTQVDA